MKRVVMLVANNWEIDSRVIREASAVADAGYDVHVICDKAEATYTKVLSAGVTYHCLPAWKPREHLARLPGVLIFHLRVSAAAVAQAWKGRRFSNAALLAAKMVTGVLIVMALTPLLLFFPLIALMRRPASPSNAVQPESLVRRLLRGIRKFIWHRFAIDSAHYLNQFGVRAAPLALSLKPDVIHAHDLVTLSGGYAVARTSSIPLIYDAHELETHTNYWGLNPHMRRWVETYERTLVKRCVAIVTVCESIADWLHDNYHVQRPVVVHNTPNLTQSAPTTSARATLRSAIGLGRDVPLAVYVGSVTIDRGLVESVRALAFAPSLHFAFVGPRYIETEKDILQAAREIGVTDRIHLVDAVLEQSEAFL